MKDFINWCYTGFGTGVTGFRGIGWAIIALLFGVIALYYIVKWTVDIAKWVMRMVGKDEPVTD